MTNLKNVWITSVDHWVIIVEQTKLLLVICGCWVTWRLHALECQGGLSRGDYPGGLSRGGAIQGGLSRGAIQGGLSRGGLSRGGLSKGGGTIQGGRGYPGEFTVYKYKPLLFSQVKHHLTTVWKILLNVKSPGTVAINMRWLMVLFRSRLVREPLHSCQMVLPQNDSILTQTFKNSLRIRTFS